MVSGNELLYYRQLCDSSFFHFVRIVGGSSKQGGIISRGIHEPLCHFAQSGGLRTAICMPRDWLKSTVFTKWKTVWDYLQDPEERQLIASENERIASDMLYWIQQQVFTNKLLRTLYSDRLSYLDKDGQVKLIDQGWAKAHRWSRTAMDLPRKGSYSEPSIRAIGVRGAAQSGHYTTIRIDDLVGESAMESNLVMQDVFRWFDNCYELLVHPFTDHPEASKIQIVGTHWGPGDFFTYVQEKYPEFEWRIVPCRSTPAKSRKKHVVYLNNPDVDTGESNWPRFPTDYYVEMLNNPEKVNIYWSQHMNSPDEGSGLTKIDPSWFRYYRYEKRDKGWYVVCEKADETDGEEFRVTDIPLFGMLDPGGFADKKLVTKGSRNAVLVGGQARDSVKKFVMHAEAFKFKNPNDFMDKVFSAHDKWKPRIWRIDTVGTQPYIYRDIIQERARRRVHLPISPIPEDKRKDSKDTDIEAMFTSLANGEWYIHKSMKDLIAEATSYPGGITRDLLDMMAKLFKLYLKRGKRVDSMKINLQRSRYSTSKRDPVTGY